MKIVYKMKWLELYRNNKLTFYLIILISILVIIILGCVLFPNLFYDQWIWKYYWGPVVADATPNVTTVIYNGVQANEGYTFVSEITYGIILIISLYAIYKFLKKLEVSIDWNFFLALTPYIIFGPVTRALEDTGYFHEPFVYWFISPLIYLQVAVYALFFLILGYFVEKKFKKPYLTSNKILFYGGFFILLPFLLLTVRWILGDTWGTTNGIRFDIFILIIFLVLLITFLVYFISSINKKNDKILVFKNPLNLTMIFGHMIDGLTSYISIYDPLNMGIAKYVEKHPASNLLMEIWPPLFPIVKFLLIILVIYLFDILYKGELKNYINLIGLLKIGIIILGLSPGLRDLLRVTMGV